MTKLPKSAPVLTPAGTVMLPESICVFAPPTNDELRVLFDHLYEVGMPAERWAEHMRTLGITKVSEIRSIVNLVAAWIWVEQWKREVGVTIVANSSWSFPAQCAVKHKTESVEKRIESLFG